MAALNYVIQLVDTTDNGLGPYTLAVIENPTLVTDGTTRKSDTNATGTKNFQELAAIGALHAGSLIAQANNTGTN